MAHCSDKHDRRSSLRLALSVIACGGGTFHERYVRW